MSSVHQDEGLNAGSLRLAAGYESPMREMLPTGVLPALPAQQPLETVCPDFERQGHQATQLTLGKAFF